MNATHTLAFCLSALLYSGCMFNIVSVKQEPTSFAPVTMAASGTETFTLSTQYAVRIGTGFTTNLNAGTRWEKIGTIPQGAVFTSKDQVLTVEASNIHEAALVISQSRIVGFYLLVEKTFCPAKQTLDIK